MNFMNPPVITEGNGGGGVKQYDHLGINVRQFKNEGENFYKLAWKFNIS
jgi:hypothetical protein